MAQSRIEVMLEMLKAWNVIPSYNADRLDWMFSNEDVITIQLKKQNDYGNFNIRFQIKTARSFKGVHYGTTQTIRAESDIG